MMIYRAAGSPAIEAPAVGTCRLCGADDRGQPFQRWVKSTFNDHDCIGPGEIVCRGCLLVTQNFSEFYQRLLARDKPQKPWNWSHFVRRGEYIVLSKGDKSRMAEVLLSDPEIAVIAVSGQKHLVFRAQPGVWQFELTPIRADPSKLGYLLGITERLYTEGASKDEILSGRYDGRSIMRIGLERWRALDSRLTASRGGPMLELAVFLTQKQETDADHDDGAGEPTTAGGQYALL